MCLREGIYHCTAHALSCPFAGFPSIRHNEVRDILASSLMGVAHNVAVEPHFQPLTEEQFQLRSASTEDQARLDVVASGVWGGGGVGSNALLLMYGCSTLMRLRTAPPLSPPATSATSKRNGVDTIAESEKWSGPLFSPLCSLPPEDSARVLLHW